jgi:hypothetical protein
MMTIKAAGYVRTVVEPVSEKMDSLEWHTMILTAAWIRNFLSGGVIGVKSGQNGKQ